MKKKLNIVNLILIVLIVLTNYNCSFIQPDHFVGEWYQIKNFGGQDISAGRKPWRMRISKPDTYYVVESDMDEGKFKPYLGGRYKLSDDKNYLINFNCLTNQN